MTDLISKLKNKTNLNYLWAALAILVIYAPGFMAPYFLDDNHTIQNNPFVHQIQNIWYFWQSGASYSVAPSNYGYRPITLLSNIVLWWMGDGSPLPFQIFKKLLFIALVVVFGFYLKRLLNIRNFFKFTDSIEKNLFMWFCFFVFALHPLHVENLDYISSTSSLLCGFFYLLSLYYYLGVLEKADEYLPESPDSFKDSKWLGVLSGLFYFLACMAKEEGITLIAVVILFEIVKKSRWKQAIVRLIPLFAAAALSLLVLWMKYEPTSSIARGTIPRSFYFMTQWKAYMFYWYQHILPVYFNADNLNFAFVNNYGDILAWSMLALNLVLVGTAIYLFRKMPGVLFCVGIFYIGVSPSSSIIPLSEAVNDHRTLISSFGSLVLTSYLVFKFVMLLKGKWQRPVLITLLVVLSVLTFKRNQDWSSRESIQRDTYLKNPKSPRAINNYALVMMSQADYVKSHELLDYCLQEAPTYFVCNLNKAITFQAQANEVEAEKFYKKATELDPVGIEALSSYADFLMARGRFHEARKLVETAISRTKGNDRFLQDRLRRISGFLGES